MKIFAYADTHIGTKATLSELQLSPDYSKCQRFIELVKVEKPAMVVCVGDFTEGIWDTVEELDAEHEELIHSMKAITQIFVRGNHDAHVQGQDAALIDGMLFTHGHGWERASEGFIERLHDKANHQSRFTIVAHTHTPALGENYMDVGSLTLTGTFGELDAVKRVIREL